MENIQEKAAMHTMKFSHVWVSTLGDAQRTSTAAISLSHPVAQKAPPDWIWIGQEALSNRFHRVIFEAFLCPSWGQDIRSLWSCFSQEFYSPHMQKFLYYCAILHLSAGTRRSLLKHFFVVIFREGAVSCFRISWYTASFQSIDSQTSVLSSSMFFI